MVVALNARRRILSDYAVPQVTERRALEHYETDGNTLRPTRGFLLAAGQVLDANVVHGDTLNDADQVEMCDWQPYSAGRFQRVWSNALLPESDLFWQEWVQDPQPVHYSQFASANVRSPAAGAKR